MSDTSQFAIITGASSGIGFELAKELAGRGYNLLVVADEPQINEAAALIRESGVEVLALEADLATQSGVDKAMSLAAGRPLDVLVANAGRGLGGAFLDQNFEDIARVINTNISGTIYLIQQGAQQMRERRSGHILITGSIAGFIPGTYAAVYNGTKAFIDSFSFALRAELNDTGVSVTCLMPGATETKFFDRAGMLNTKVGQSKKDDAHDVAVTGLDAMLRGDGDIVSGWHNKIQAALASITPSGMLAEQHREMAEPGSANK